MYNKPEIRILKEIYLNEGIHKRELARKVSLSMPSVENALKKIKKIVIEKKLKNQIEYMLDYSKKEVIPFLYLIEYQRINEIPGKVRIAIFDFLKELDDKPIISILFGSYVKGNYNSNSDIDLLVVFQKSEGREVEKIAKKINMQNNSRLSVIYMNFDDFRKSFFDSSKEFFRDLEENKIILNGIEWWVELKNEKT